MQLCALHHFAIASTCVLVGVWLTHIAQCSRALCAVRPGVHHASRGVCHHSFFISFLLFIAFFISINAFKIDAIILACRRCHRPCRAPLSASLPAEMIIRLCSLLCLSLAYSRSYIVARIVMLNRRRIIERTRREMRWGPMDRINCIRLIPENWITLALLCVHSQARICALHMTSTLRCREREGRERRRATVCHSHVMTISCTFISRTDGRVANKLTIKCQKIRLLLLQMSETTRTHKTQNAISLYRISPRMVDINERSG